LLLRILEGKMADLQKKENILLEQSKGSGNSVVIY
jgi:hypothetical protein